MNHWKLTAIGIALVTATALITGVVVANWRANQEATQAPAQSAPPMATAAKPATRAVPSAGLVHQAAGPSPSDVAACNEYAKAQTDSTTEVLKDALIGGAVGAGVGAAGGAIAGGGKGAGKGAGIGGLVGATAGTLFGLNENRQHDSRYVEAYRACMRGRGYPA